jgi:HSP20 family protein
MFAQYNYVHPIDRFFANVLPPSHREAQDCSAQKGRYTPRFRVQRLDSEWVMRAEVPGVARENLAVSVAGTELSVKGKRHALELDANGNVAFVEFERRFTLAAELDGEKLQASLADGVLTLRIPHRQKEAPGSVQIAIG